jgi:hypothetical protein
MDGVVLGLLLSEMTAGSSLLVKIEAAGEEGSLLFAITARLEGSIRFC